LPIKSITLFVFGGVAEMEGDPKAPIAELLMALAGPAVSVVLGFCFLALAGLFPSASTHEYYGVLNYLGVLNFTLAAFNMAPALPLDGGRVLRALIWLVTGDAPKATNIAARTGEFVGMLMMALGAIAALGAGLATGLWWIILGWFILSMARAHRAEAIAKRLLSGAKVGDLMSAPVITADADLSVADFVENVLARHPHDLIPVRADDRIVGVAGFNEVRLTPRETWRDVRLSHIMTRFEQVPRADQSEPIEAALERLQKAGASRLIVMDGSRLAGILTLKDLAAHLQFRAEFGAQQRAGSAP
jgi:CBS domain-containing protein